MPPTIRPFWPNGGAVDPQGFDIAYYTYRIGTAPCEGDVLDWTRTSVGGSQGIPVDLEYNRTYYVCVHATNTYGAQSDQPAVTDGITILDPLGDPDADGFSSSEELIPGSDPLNPLSIPAYSEVHIHEGFNMVAIPAEVLGRSDLRDWLDTLGNGAEIERVLAYDKAHGRFVTLLPGAADNPAF